MSLEDISALNEQLYGLPGGVLTFVLCLGVGLIGKIMEDFPNRWIPRLVLVAGPLWFCLLAPGKDAAVHWPAYIARNIAVGFIVAVLAWFFHHKVLSHLEDWLSTKFPSVGKLLGPDESADTIRSHKKR